MCVCLHARTHMHYRFELINIKWIWIWIHLICFSSPARFSSIGQHPRRNLIGTRGVRMSPIRSWYRRSPTFLRRSRSPQRQKSRSPSRKKSSSKKSRSRSASPSLSKLKKKQAQSPSKWVQLLKNLFSYKYFLSKILLKYECLFFIYI